MSKPSSLSDTAMEEFRVNLVKDGGRAVMYGGDPYEDDVERVPCASGEAAAPKEVRGSGRA